MTFSNDNSIGLFLSPPEAAEGGTGKEKENQKYSYVLKRSAGPERPEDQLSVTGMWSFPPTLKEGDNFKLSDLDLRFMDKVNYDELERRLKKDYEQTNKLFSTVLDFFLPGFHSDYYLIEGVSDFWKYKVGEEVSLERITASDSNGGNSGSTGKNGSEKLLDFQIVSGVIPYTSTPVWCTPNPYPGLWPLDIWYKSYKANAIKEQGVNNIYKSECEPKENIPSYTLIFLGDQISNKKSST